MKVRLLVQWEDPHSGQIFEAGHEGVVLRTEVAGDRTPRIHIGGCGRMVSVPPNMLEEVK
jgi:hypothetical protein